MTDFFLSFERSEATKVKIYLEGTHTEGLVQQVLLKVLVGQEADLAKCPT